MNMMVIVGVDGQIDIVFITLTKKSNLNTQNQVSVVLKGLNPAPRERDTEHRYPHDSKKSI